MNDRLPDCGGITKTHFALCRVNVYVDSRRIEFQKEKGNRILTFHERSMVALTDSRCEKRAFNGAPVYKNQLLRPCLPAQSCLPDKSSCANVEGRCAIYFNKAFQYRNTI